MLNGILLPALLIVLGLVAAAITYRGIRRGGARFYTLERELILRRAALWLLVTVVGFAGAIAILFYQRQQLLTTLNPPAETAETEEGEAVEGAPTTTPFLDQFPPTATATSSVPTETVEPTAVLCRGVVEGTSGNGLRLRDAPNGAELVVLPEGTLLTVLDDAPEQAGEFTWRKVRAVGGEEGWVVQDFLTVRSPCGEVPSE
jgi:hypothetical protein